MKVFVAGATGVIGRRLVPLLVDAGAEVTGVARSAEKSAQLKKQGARPVKVDLFDPPAVEAAVQGHDIVINMATHVPSGVRLLLPGAFNEHSRIRTEASQNLASAAMATRARVFIQESYAPTYPDRGDEWIDENVPLEPAPHVRSVADAESAAAEFTKSGGTGIVLRFSMFYGPDAAHTLDMLDAMKRGIVPSFGVHDAYMSSIWIDDAASGALHALSVPSGVYNVTDDVPMRRREAFELLAEAMGLKTPKTMPGWMSRAMGSVDEARGRSLRISNAKFRQAGNWVPTVPSLREGWKILIEQVALKSGSPASA